MLLRRRDNPMSSPRLRQLLRRLNLEDSAQDLIEYALVAVLMALMCAVALSPVAEALNNGVAKTGKKFKEHVDRGLHKGWYK